jgi:hypothetical protein
VVENYKNNKTIFKGALINFDGKTVEGIDEENAS